MDCFELYNGFSLPVIGYGTFPQKETLSENVPIVYRSGYRMIDTSDNYANEQFVGDGLRMIKSDEIVVVTKFSQPMRTDELDACFNESLVKLNMEGGGVVYLLHWPFPYLWKQQWRKMEELYLHGECAAIGVCNFDEGYLRELLQFCRVKPMINQIERHPLFQQKELVNLCKREKIQVMSYSPLARMDTELSKNQILQKIAYRYGKTVNQVILRWNIDTHCIPLPASSSEKHILENMDVFDFKLTDEEICTINDLDNGKRIRFNPRTRFNHQDQRKFLLEHIIVRSFLLRHIVKMLKRMKRRYRKH